VLARFQEHDERLSRHRGGRSGMTGASGPACDGAVSLRKCDLVLVRLVQAYRDEPRLGCHRALSPENLDRPRDLAGVQGIERMTGRGRVMPADGVRAGVIFVVPALAHYHGLSSRGPTPPSSAAQPSLS
jgi:hypothetical protein